MRIDLFRTAMLSRWTPSLGAFLLGALTLTACSSGAGAPTAPTSAWPDVTGVYAGMMNLTVDQGTSTMSIDCPASTVVTQADDTVTVAPIALSGACGTTTMPIGVLAIDQTGSIRPDRLSQSYVDPNCGTYQSTGSGGFTNREMRLSLSVTSSMCNGFTLKATLMRGQ